MFKRWNLSTQTSAIQRGNIESKCFGVKKRGVCFIINVQCTLDNCAVSSFFQVCCCSAATSPPRRTSPKLKMRGIFFSYPWGAKTENEKRLVKIQRRWGRDEKRGWKTSARALVFFSCSVLPQHHLREESFFKPSTKKIQIEDERDAYPSGNGREWGAAS